MKRAFLWSWINHRSQALNSLAVSSIGVLYLLQLRNGLDHKLGLPL
jgi:hypothetical protein